MKTSILSYAFILVFLGFSLSGQAQTNRSQEAMAILMKLANKSDEYRKISPKAYKGSGYYSPQTIFVAVPKPLYETIFNNTLANGYECAAVEMLNKKGDVLWSRAFTSRNASMIDPGLMNQNIRVGLYDLISKNVLDQLRTIVFIHSHPSDLGFSNINNIQGDIPSSYFYKAVLEEAGLVDVNFDWILIRPQFWQTKKYKLNAFQLQGSLKWRNGDYPVRGSDWENFTYLANEVYIRPLGLAIKNL